MRRVPVLICLIVGIAGCERAPADVPERGRTAAEAREAGGLGPDPIASETLAVGPRDAQAELHRLVSTWPVRFREGSAAIEDGAEALFERVAALLRRNADLRIRVSTTVKSERTSARNLRLSQTMAEAVVKGIAEFGVDEERMTPLGYGQVRPVPPEAPPGVRETNPHLWIVVKRPD